MANQEHLDILKQGGGLWSQWRKEHPNIRPNLRGADLGSANIGSVDLSGVDLSSANLSSADLRFGYLRFADLGFANLSKGNLNCADLTEANLNRAILSGADLSSADLRGADLRFANLDFAKLDSADLRFANLSEANLNRAQLSHAIVRSTTFGDVDLSVANGLETVRHEAPSTIGIDTIIRSHGKVPEIFLRKAGIPQSIIEQIPALVSSLKPIDYYSCFISYSSKDQDFAERLYADLQAKEVRCWFAPEDLKIGAKIRVSIDESIRLHDKLLLVLSQTSVTSQWVEQEVERALARERKENKVILFPIRVDNTVMDIEEGWPALIRNTRNIGDFTHWKNHDAYQKAFTRLLRDLKASI